MDCIPFLLISFCNGLLTTLKIAVSSCFFFKQKTAYEISTRDWSSDVVLFRSEHEDNANTMGRLAGRNMAGQSEPYHHLPSFYSDMFELGYEAVGELDSRLETFADWKQPNKVGVIYYLQNGRVRGVLLWNVWGQVDAARELIAEPGPFRAENLEGRLK